MEFHPRTGANATLSDNKTSARRINAEQTFHGAMVFSDQALEDDCLFQVAVKEKMNKWNGVGGLTIGVTSQRPDLIVPMPKYLYNMAQCWSIYGDYAYSNSIGSKINLPCGCFKNLAVGDRVGVLRKRTGALHVYVNGDDNGAVVANVPARCYAVVNVFDAAVIKQDVIDITSWKIVDFKDRLSTAADLLKRKQDKNLKTSCIAKESYIPSARFAHKALPGFKWFLKVHLDGYGKDQNGAFVAVELCVEKSSKKSSAAAPSARFSVSFASAKGGSIGPATSQLTTFAGDAFCVIEQFASVEMVRAFCGTDGSVSVSGKITVELASHRHTEYLRRSYESGAFSDFQIEVENEIVAFPVHKHILAEASPVFATMFNSQCDEPKTGKVTIKQSSLDAVKAMLQFIYGDPLCFGGLHGLAIDVMVLADRYDLGDLKKMCHTSLTEMVSKESLSFTQLVDVLKLSEQYDLPDLMKGCEKSLRQKVSKENVPLYAQLAHLHSVEYLKEVVFQFIVDNKEASIGLNAVQTLLQFITDPLCFDGMQDLSIDVLKLADQYDLSDLKDMCENALGRMTTKENVLQFAQIAELYFAVVLKKAVFQFIFDNQDVMTEDTWIKFREANFKLGFEIQDFILAKQREALSKK